MTSRHYTLWGPELSPFVLKTAAALEFAGVQHRRLPREGTSIENVRYHRRVRRIRAGREQPTYPDRDELDELALVPFLFGDEQGEVIFDSSAMVEWVDSRHAPSGRASCGLLAGDPAVRFAASLIEDYFDEFGLYMVHHNRWVLSAENNDAGLRLAREFGFPRAIHPMFAAWFSRRQVRRLPYLFSVASHDAEFTGLAVSRRPPCLEGFPATHALIDDAFRRCLDRLEYVLADQHYLMGSSFTVADAAAYGQLAMNLTDPPASDAIMRHAPLTHGWLEQIASGRFAQSNEPPILTTRLRPLLEEIGRTYGSLMEQNERAYERHRAAGETLFNEAAFDAGRALYDGEIDGVPFRAVAKSFQVKTWRDLKRRWAALSPSERDAVGNVMPS